MRLSVGLTIVGALLLMAGVLMALAGEAMELTSPSGWQPLISAGEIMAALGLGSGLGVVFVLAADVPRVRRPYERAAQRGHAAQRESTNRRDHASPRERSSSRERSSKRRRDVDAEDWLSPFRPAGTEQVPETEPGVPGYSDDGWHPEEVSATDTGRSAFGDGIYDPGQETLPRFDPAADPRMDYLAQALPASEPEAWRIDGNGLQARDGSDLGAIDDSGAVDDSRLADDTAPLPVIALDGSPVPIPDRWPEDVSARAKLDQIKDLYLTAEAIGEDALVKHFDELSERQRRLIRDYFDQAGLGLGSK